MSRTWQRQWKTLTRHFINEFFINDYIQAEQQMRERTITLLIILMNLSLVLSHKLLLPYLIDPRVVILGSGWTAERVWLEKTFFTTISMGIIGIITVLQWDRIFLSPRDHANLRPLPVHDRLMFLGKISSIAFFILIVSLAINLVSTGVYILYLSDPLRINPIYFGLVLVASHFFSGIFTFLFIAVVQGFIQAFSPLCWQRRLSFYLQLLLLLLFIMLLIWFPRLYPTLKTLQQNNSLFYLLFPPIWFVGLSEALTGNAVFAAQAKYALAAVLLSAALYSLLFSLGFNRSLRSHDPSSPARKGRSIIRRSGEELLHRMLLKSSQERAVFYFAGGVWRKSRPHKLRLGIFLALPIAFFAVQCLTQAWVKNLDFFHTPNIHLVSATTFFSLALVAGLKGAASLPIDLPANWIFRQTEPVDKSRIRSGIRKAMGIQIILPLLTMIFFIFTFFWGIPTAAIHLLFQAILIAVVMEIAFFHFHKIPFACSYLPGKAKIGVFWIPYLLGLLIAVSGLTALELALLRHPDLTPVFVLSGLSLLFLIRFSYRYSGRMREKLIFEEKPAPVLLTISGTLS